MALMVFLCTYLDSPYLFCSNLSLLDGFLGYRLDDGKWVKGSINIDCRYSKWVLVDLWGEDKHSSFKWSQ